MLNLIQKMHALMVSEKINLWHFPYKPAGEQTFYYWLIGEEDKKGRGFYTLDGMIENAYKHIDPLLQPLPEEIPFKEME